MAYQVVFNFINQFPPGVLFAAFVGSMMTLLVCGAVIVRTR